MRLPSRRLVAVMLLAVWTLSGCAADSPEGSPAAPPADPLADPPRNAEAARLIGQLEAIEPGTRFDYFDLHGNANDELQALQLARFEATGEIIQAIDRLEGDARRIDLVKALYFVLGFVQDPASIAWIRGRIATGRSDLLYDRWLPTFSAGSNGSGAWDWLKGREHWVAFFIDTFERETRVERRTALLDVLALMDSAPVERFFIALNGRTLGHRETLLVEAYERMHGRRGNDAHLTSAIDALAADHANHQFLIETAYKLPHPAFVPFLTAFVERRPEEHSRVPMFNAQDALKKITFEVRAAGKAEWRQWLVAHGAEGRDAWRARAVAAMRGLLAKDEEAARTFFDNALSDWDDIALLPFVEQELVSRPAFHGSVTRWLCLVHRPAHHARLEPLARKLMPHVARLSEREREGLLALGYSPERNMGTWADYVRASNSYI